MTGFVVQGHIYVLLFFDKNEINNTFIITEFSFFFFFLQVFYMYFEFYTAFFVALQVS